MNAEEIVTRLGLKPHPEGGHYVQTFRAPEGTAIYFLLKAGERSHWHKVTNADEIWHHYAGAPLELSLSEDGKSLRHVRLGPGLVRPKPHRPTTPPVSAIFFA